MNRHVRSSREPTKDEPALCLVALDGSTKTTMYTELFEVVKQTAVIVWFGFEQPLGELYALVPVDPDFWVSTLRKLPPRSFRDSSHQPATTCERTRYYVIERNMGALARERLARSPKHASRTSGCLPRLAISISRSFRLACLRGAG
jgi:hypothetical protein